MKSGNNKSENVLDLVDRIHAELIRLEAKAGHSAEMARVRRARHEAERLRKLLRSKSERSRWLKKMETYFPFLSEVALILMKRS